MENSVLKFGGTSVGDFEKIKEIAESLKDRTILGEKLIVVVSAMGGTTDALLSNVSRLSPAPKDDHIALLVTTGEQQTISYLSIVLEDLGVRTKAMTGFQAGIKTFGGHMKSRIADIDKACLLDALEENDILVVAGFQGVNDQNEITTLGRGGSDTTAVAIAASCDMPCEIYTDVDGIYATDPRVYKDAKRIYGISYDEMMEMSALGAGVIETRSIEIAKNHSIPIYLGKTLSDEKGTWIMQETEVLERKAVTGAALDEDIILATIFEPHVDSTLIFDLFKRFEEEAINVDMISQVAGNEGFQLSFTIKGTEAGKLDQIFAEIQMTHSDMFLTREKDFAKVSIIGSGMRDMSGVASKAFMALNGSGIKFYQTTTSEISISYVVDKIHGKHAVESLAAAFDL
ncbi:aspartate kinase [Salinicoccus halodurans]|uniref:Aspartokinase n=1 Tax=Salinicoccus halodurans TaxID=407035 RepID=A0A0F7HM12_9STAP|nr:aspartate kinase [Salinicoccus halodurans]AKG74142.1 aspartate kinase [Salinicoccus halodurans]SFK61066.1 aspartate kinase [Salinicoccus halodurans]